MNDSPRIQELRRRVETNPASLAFAPLAEELRRAGRLDEAVRVCRAGLQHHPEYVSARATLGRALADQRDDDAGLAELTAVLDRAPDNLAALRGLTEILQRRADRPEALEPFRRALSIARQTQDPELQQAVRWLEARSAPPAPKAGENTASRRALRKLEALLDAVLADRARRAAGFRP